MKKAKKPKWLKKPRQASKTKLSTARARAASMSRRIKSKKAQL
jgi:hypothetical protein